MIDSQDRQYFLRQSKYFQNFESSLVSTPYVSFLKIGKETTANGSLHRHCCFDFPLGTWKSICLCPFAWQYFKRWLVVPCAALTCMYNKKCTVHCVQRDLLFLNINYKYHLKWEESYWYYNLVSVTELYISMNSMFGTVPLPCWSFMCVNIFIFEQVRSRYNFIFIVCLRKLG